MPSAPDRSGPAPPPRTEAVAFGAPLLLLNLKTYPVCLGEGARTVARALSSAARELGVGAAIAPATPDLGRLSAELSIPVLAQHTDVTPAGPHTGTVPPEALRAAGVRGSLVNHSEHRLDAATTERTCVRLTALGLIPVVCAGTVEEARELARLRPPYLAVEPPELIGGDRAVSTARPEVVEGTVVAVREVSPDTRVLCGAGVHDRQDVRRALELGSGGVLVASAVTRAANPRAAIAELLAGF